MAKIAMGLVLAVILGIIVMYYAGGYSSFDPTSQGDAAQAAITPGMTAKQVLDAAGDPGRYRIYRKVKHKIGDEEEESIQFGPVIKFDRTIFLRDLAANQMPDGFEFQYMFSFQSAFSVVFDPTGRVESIGDTPTAANLFDTRREK